jgi:hypothetical protein
MKLKIIVFSVVLAVLCGIAYAAYCAHQVATVVVPNAYATDWASEFVVEHLKSTDNQWPRGWHDLRDEYDRLAEPNHYPWPWEELQERITIDWEADPVALAKADPSNSPPFQAIWLTDGSNSHWEGSEPNLKVLRYLIESGVSSAPP